MIVDLNNEIFCVQHIDACTIHNHTAINTAKLYRILATLKAIGSTDPNLKILVNSFAICKTNVEKIHISINIVEEQHGKLDLNHANSEDIYEPVLPNYPRLQVNIESY